MLDVRLQMMNDIWWTIDDRKQGVDNLPYDKVAVGCKMIHDG